MPAGQAGGEAGEQQAPAAKVNTREMNTTGLGWRYGPRQVHFTCG